MDEFDDDDGDDLGSVRGFTAPRKHGYHRGFVNDARRLSSVADNRRLELVDHVLGKMAD